MPSAGRYAPIVALSTLNLLIKSFFRTFLIKWGATNKHSCNAPSSESALCIAFSSAEIPYLPLSPAPKVFSPTDPQTQRSLSGPVYE